MKIVAEMQEDAAPEPFWGGAPGREAPAGVDGRPAFLRAPLAPSTPRNALLKHLNGLLFMAEMATSLEA